jgi:uncharacterized membrane protein YkvA (DUF1232 family)
MALPNEHPATGSVPEIASAPPRVQKKLRRLDPQFVQEGSRQITEADMQQVVDRADDIEARFRTAGPLARFVDEARLLVALVRDYARGEYRRVPYWSLAGIVFALLYVLNPLDLIPDFLPVVGFLDDAVVVSYALRLIEQDLRSYERWRQEPKTLADVAAQRDAHGGGVTRIFPTP